MILGNCKVHHIIDTLLLQPGGKQPADKHGAPFFLSQLHSIKSSREQPGACSNTGDLARVSTAAISGSCCPRLYVVTICSSTTLRYMARATRLLNCNYKANSLTR